LVDNPNFDYIGVSPQGGFMPGMTLDRDEKYKFMAWNSVGSVAVKQDENSGFSVI